MYPEETIELPGRPEGPPSPNVVLRIGADALGVTAEVATLRVLVRGERGFRVQRRDSQLSPPCPGNSTSLSPDEQVAICRYLPIARWTERIALEPSPTAAAIRFIEP